MQSSDSEEIRNKLGGVSRRDFLKFCTVMAASIGLPLGMGWIIYQKILKNRNSLKKNR